MQGRELAQGIAQPPARRATAASVVAPSARTRIYTHDVPSAAVAVAQILGGCCARFALAVALGAICLNALLRESVPSRMTLQVLSVTQIPIDAEGFLEIGRRTVSACDEITLLNGLQHRQSLLDGNGRSLDVRRMNLPRPAAFGTLHHAYARVFA